MSVLTLSLHVGGVAFLSLLLLTAENGLFTCISAAVSHCVLICSESQISSHIDNHYQAQRLFLTNQTKV